MSVTDGMTVLEQRVAVRHYPAYVGGSYVDTDRRTYGIDVAALLDPAGGSELWRRLLSGDPASDRHPYVIGSVAVADERLVGQALQAAAAAAPQWAAVPLADRIRTVAHARDRLLAHRAELTALMLAEGCPRALADWQVASAANAMDQRAVDWCAGQMEQEVALDRRRLRLVRRPDGVVCVNPPRNAPASNGLLSLWALAAGNAVVIRVPRSVPVSLSYLLAEILAPALADCHAPPGTLNVVCGDQPAIMRQWLASPAVSSIFYFGTSASGESVQRR